MNIHRTITINKYYILCMFQFLGFLFIPTNVYYYIRLSTNCNLSNNFSYPFFNTSYLMKNLDTNSRRGIIINL